MSEQRPDVSINLIADDAAKTLDFYVAGLGAEVVERWVDPENGKIGNAEFRIGSQTLFIADDYASMDSFGVKSPGALGGTSLSLWVRVDDLERALQRALDAGARLLVPI